MTLAPYDLPELLSVPAERELPDAVGDLLIRDFFAYGFDAGGTPEALADALSAHLRRFSCVFLFLRIKGTGKSYDPSFAPEHDTVRERLDPAISMLCRVLRQTHRCIPCCVDGYLALLLELDEETAAQPDDMRYPALERLLEQARSEVSAALSLELQITCSGIERGLDNLASAFLTALFSVDYVFDIYPRHDVISFYTPMQHVPDTSTLAPKPEWEKLYFDAILDYNFSKAERLLFNLVERELSNPNSALSIRNRLHARMACTLSMLGVPVNPSLSECVRIHQIVTDITACKTILKMNAHIEEFFERLTAYYRTATLSMDQKLDMIIDYIAAHYADPALSVGSLSETFHISLGYLSRAFRQKTGVKLIDYIHLTRLRKAREQILRTDAPLHEIAESVGYAGEWSLQRAFRRYENITPGSLRNGR